jgi:hypothetical protein
MSEPLTFTVTVDTPLEQSFALFANHMGDWWPLGELGVFTDVDSTVAFEGDLLVERAGDKESTWGEVIQWEPPLVVATTWHPGSNVAGGTDIRVSFDAADGDSTTVTLVHDGWARVDDPEASSAEYAKTWPGVLDRFVTYANESTASAS